LYKLKTSDVIPYDMLEYDLGKKDDLIKVFEHLTNLFKDCKTFRFIKADIAIFVPYWKIVLTTNQNDIYKPLFIFLGVWHIFKIMVERIWFEFFDVFWWRFSVNIYKDQTQLKKPKLNYLLNFFFNLQIQFEFVREDFEKFLQDNKNPNYGCAGNLYHLILKTIPKIKNFYLSLKVNNFDIFEKALYELYAEFLITTSHNYQKGIVLQMLIFQHLKKVNHRIYLEFLLKEYSSLLEEINETQLSFLSSDDAKELCSHSK
jgi:hypothetical protein